MTSVVNVLDEGFAVQMLRRIGETDALSDTRFDFFIDTPRVVSGLRLPKVEKRMKSEADFLLKVDVCVIVVETVELFAMIEIK